MQKEIQKIGHAEFISASSTQAVLPWKQQRQALKTLNQVQGDLMITRASGFTLVELLVVVLIIGILAAVALPQYQFVIQKTRANQRLMIISSLSESLERYYMENNQYPTISHTSRLDELNTQIDLQIQLPSSLRMIYNPPTYVTVYEPSIDANEKFFIGKLLLQNSANPYHGLFICYTSYKEDNNSLPSRICKNICQVSALQKVWGSGEFGCRF